MKLVRKSKISYLQPDWASSPLVAGFSTRNGGVSRSPYNSLNLGLNTDDVRANVEGNRATLAHAFGLEPHQLLTVSQVHGDHILVIDQPNFDLSHFQRVECDAILCNQPGILVGILVADCFPVLLAAPGKGAVAAVHAGWRGVASRLIERTIEALARQFKVFPEELVAAVGPGIGAHSYEVDRPVRDAFRKAGLPWQDLAEEVRLGHWNLDLARACEMQLTTAGVPATGIDVASECTCCHKELFFSHRRDRGVTGRQMGFVGRL
ncbi:MAG: peptidoglycan editing factor PgeF [Geothermobacteraceae bacterium]